MKKPGNSTDKDLLNNFVIQHFESFPAQVDFTTNSGIEQVVKEEFLQNCQQISTDPPTIIPKPYHAGGHVHLRSGQPLSAWLPLIRSLRSVEHVILTLSDFQLNESSYLAQIRQKLSNLTIPILAYADSFRITSIRSGNHPFTSMDVQREAGSIVEAQYGVQVDLENYDVEIRVDVFDNHCLVGVQLTNQSLADRLNRTYIPRVSLKAHIAYTLIHYASLTGREEAVLDPFCGSGTLLLELNQVFPHLSLYGTDLYETVLAGTQQNIALAQANHQVHLQQADIFNLRKVLPAENFDAIITNPPFGIKLSKQKNFSNFYNYLLQEAFHVLKPQGIMVLFTMKADLLKKAIGKNGGWEIKNSKKIELGGIAPSIFKLKKL